MFVAFDEEGSYKCFTGATLIRGKGERHVYAPHPPPPPPPTTETPLVLLLVLRLTDHLMEVQTQPTTRFCNY